jgi:hypothetical protein
MNETTISWTATNMITIWLMAAVGGSLFAFIANQVAKKSGG